MCLALAAAGTAHADEPEAVPDPAPDAQTAACDEAAQNIDLGSNVEIAQLAWTTMDIDFFLDATDQLRIGIDCTQEELSPHAAASVLRSLALRQVMDKQPEQAAETFASARLVEPYYRFPTSMIPAANPVNDWYTVLDKEDTEFTEVPPPAAARMQMNGKLSLQRPDWPVVVQIINDEGDVRSTVLLAPGEPMPEYEPAPKGAALNYNYDAKVVPLHVPLNVGAGAMGAVAVGLLAVGISNKAKLYGPDTTFEELDGLRTQANTFSGLGTGAGAVAIGLATTAVLTKRF